MLKSNGRLVALPCILTLGAFSSERIFEVTLADGQIYRSIAPRQFCWNEQGRLVEEREPATEVEGMIAARVLEHLDDDQAIVEIPNGEVIAVDESNVKPRPTPIYPPEPKSQVSFGS